MYSVYILCVSNELKINFANTHKVRSRGATRSKFRKGQIVGLARTEGMKRPRIESEARTESEAGDITGEESGVGAR